MEALLLLHNTVEMEGRDLNNDQKYGGKQMKFYAELFGIAIFCLVILLGFILTASDFKCPPFAAIAPYAHLPGGTKW